MHRSTVALAGGSSLLTWAGDEMILALEALAPSAFHHVIPEIESASRRRRVRPWWCVAAVLVVGCRSADPADAEMQERVASLESKTDAIQADQQKILAALQRIEVALSRPRGAATAEPPAPPVKVTIDVGSSPIRGPQNAPVTLVVFSDFQCPYCAKLEPTLAQALAAYPSEVRFVFKQFPLAMHPNARPAALAALAAGEQGKFWEMHDLLFQNRADLSRPKLEALAAELKLDLPRFTAAMDGKALADRVDAEVAQGRAVNVRGTPSLYVNGWLATNRTLDGLRALIDRELGRAPVPSGPSPAAPPKPAGTGT